MKMFKKGRLKGSKVRARPRRSKTLGGKESKLKRITLRKLQKESPVYSAPGI